MAPRMAGPHLARLLARLLLPTRDREFILGDLEELYAWRSKNQGRGSAHLNYLREVFASVVARRTGRSPHPRSGRPPTRARSSIFGDVAADLRHTVRTLRRQPEFVIIVALTLGVGVGAAGAVFGMVNQLLLRPVPGVADPSGAAFLEFHTEEQSATGVSGPDVEEIRRSATLFEGIATFDDVGVFASVDGSRPIDTRAITIYGDYFELLGVRPSLGRLLRADETGPDADPYVAVISERLWTTLFNRSPDVVGERFQANGTTLSVLGVAGGGFRGTDRLWQVDIWMPKSAWVPVSGFPRERLWSRDSRLNQWFVARPRRGISLEAGQHQINQLLQGMALADPGPGSYLNNLDATLHRGLLHPFIRQMLYPALGVLAGAVMLMLLIPCANVANLLLVREVHRRGEVAVRRALGASVGRIVRNRIVESVLLGTVGTLAGLAIAWLIGLMFLGESLLGLEDFEGFVLDVRVLGFASAAVLVTALLFGTLPAALAGRFDLSRGLRNAGSKATGGHSVIRHGMSALQIALSLTLLIGSILLGRSVRNLYGVDAGLTAEGVSISTISDWRLGLDAPALEALHRRLLDAVEAVPGVQAAALDAYGPYFTRLPGRISSLGPSDADAERADIYWASPGWFALMRVDMVSGRAFRGPDWNSSGPPKLIVTDPLARRLFGRTDVIGQTVFVGIRTLEEAEIVGVVGDLRLYDLRSPPDEAFFLSRPRPGLTGIVTTLVRTSTSDPGVADGVRRAVEAVVPSLPVPQLTPLTDRIDVQLSEQRIFARLLGLLSSLAVLLAAVGLYGVIAFAVASRKREFGIRLALGADGVRISRLVFKSAATIVFLGTLLGLAGAYVLSRVIESRLFGVEAVDVTSYVAAVALFSVVAVLACWVPGAAAVRVDPVDTLRTE